MGYITELRLEREGHHIDRFMLESGLSSGYNTDKKEYVRGAFNTLKDMHRFLNDEIVIVGSNHGIIAEAYYNAVLTVNRDEYPYQQPSNEICWEQLRKLVSRYLKAGYKLEDDWMDAIFK